LNDRKQFCIEVFLSRLYRQSQSEEVSQSLENYFINVLLHDNYNLMTPEGSHHVEIFADVYRDALEVAVIYLFSLLSFYCLRPF
jgi:hypothetical protein